MKCKTTKRTALKTIICEEKQDSKEGTGVQINKAKSSCVPEEKIDHIQMEGLGVENEARSYALIVVMVVMVVVI